MNLLAVQKIYTDPLTVYHVLCQSPMGMNGQEIRGCEARVESSSLKAEGVLLP
jgi:hypothetical protein